ncbi:DeoR/GlpR family DNA-binding transcription regulator [Microbacterium lacusdiani]
MPATCRREEGIREEITLGLRELEEYGAIRRIRGGAEPAPRRGSPYPFDVRAGSDRAAKQALAEAAAQLVPERATVAIDNGTTALAVADRLAGRDLTAMALSLHAAAALARHAGVEVIVPGGPVAQDDLSFHGPGAAEAVRAMRFDVAVLGACAADPEAGLTVAGWGDAQVKRALLETARRVVLVATADKFTRTAAHRFGALADLDTVVTTQDAPADVVHLLRDRGVEVVTVPCPRAPEPRPTPLRGGRTMAGVSSPEDDAVAPAAAPQARAEAGAAELLSLAALPLVPLGEDAAGLCVDGVCRLPD